MVKLRLNYMHAGSCLPGHYLVIWTVVCQWLRADNQRIEVLKRTVSLPLPK